MALPYTLLILRLTRALACVADTSEIAPTRSGDFMQGNEQYRARMLISLRISVHRCDEGTETCKGVGNYAWDCSFQSEISEVLPPNEQSHA